MVIYNSMIVWIAIVAVINNYMGNPEVECNDGSKRIPIGMAILTFCYIIFWVGMRSGVADTATYISGFNNFGSSFKELSDIFSNAKAPGFDAFSILFRTFVSTNYHLWLMTIAIVSGIAVMLTLWKHSENFLFSAFLFIVTLDFFWMLNGMRQFIAASLLFLASDLIKERKCAKFIIIVLILMTIHYTAIVLIPVYWLVKEKPFGLRMLIFIGLLISAIIFLEPSIEILEKLLEGTAYSGATSQFAEDDGVNILRVLVMLVPVVIAFFCRGIIELEGDLYINMCVNMSVISAGFYFLGRFTSGILIGRVPIYFELYNLILFPWLFNHGFTESSKKIIYFLCAVGFLLFYYLQMKDSYYISEITGLL